MADAEFLLSKVSNGTTVPLTGVVLVGRQPPATLLLTEGQCSRRHAELTVNAEGVTIEDLGSTNGTFVNDRRIDSKVLLKSGDRVRFDIEEFRFLASAPPDADKTTMRSAPSPVAADAASKAASSPTPPPPPVTPDVIVAAPAVAAHRPGSWADPEARGKGGSKTEFIDPVALKDMIKGSPAAMRSAPAAETDAPYLIVCSGASEGRQIRLTRDSAGQQEWTVGSDPERQVVLSDSGVSGLHARITNEGPRWRVVDQMSANGTFVNGKRSSVSYLATGDRLRFGPVECMLQLPRGRMTSSTATARGGAQKRKTLLIAVVSFVLTALVLFVAFRLLK